MNEQQNNKTTFDEMNKSFFNHGFDCQKTNNETCFYNTQNVFFVVFENQKKIFVPVIFNESKTEFMEILGNQNTFSFRTQKDLIALLKSEPGVCEKTFVPKTAKILPFETHFSKIAKLTNKNFEFQKTENAEMIVKNIKAKKQGIAKQTYVSNHDISKLVGVLGKESSSQKDLSF